MYERTYTPISFSRTPPNVYSAVFATDDGHRFRDVDFVVLVRVIERNETCAFERAVRYTKIVPYIDDGLATENTKYLGWCRTVDGATIEELLSNADDIILENERYVHRYDGDVEMEPSKNATQKNICGA